MELESRRFGSTYSVQPEASGQSPLVEFMSPDEFSGLINRHVSQVIFDRNVSALDVRLGFRGEVTRDKDRIDTLPDGGCETVPQFAIKIGAHLSRQDRGRTFVHELDSVRSAVLILQTGSYRITPAEYAVIEAMKAEGVERFYVENQGMVDDYLQRIAITALLSR